MKLYTLVVRDYGFHDVTYFVTHKTKTAKDLYHDYGDSYEEVWERNKKDWSLDEVLTEMEKLGWIILTPPEEVEVTY